MREPALRQRIVTDGHAPEEYRADTGLEQHMARLDEYVSANLASRATPRVANAS